MRLPFVWSERDPVRAFELSIPLTHSFRIGELLGIHLPGNSVSNPDKCVPSFLLYSGRWTLGTQPSRSEPCLYRRLERRGSGVQVVLFFGHCIELQNILRLSEEVNF
jgi:hypothetical protein